MNKYVNLNFVHQNTFSPSVLTKPGLMLLIVACAICIATFVIYLQKHTEYKTTVSTLEIKNLNKVNPAPVKVTEVSAEELAQINAIAAMLTTPWEALLSGLEEVNMDTIALLSIEPSITNQQLRIRGQAKNLQSVLAYVEALAALPMLSDVYLKKHDIEKDSALKPVNFTIESRWQ